MGLIKRVLFRHFRAAISRKSNLIGSNEFMEAVAKVNGDHHHQGTNVISHQTQEDGVVRMKILVRKQDLKQVLELMNGAGIHNQASVVRATSSFSLEQRPSLLKKKQILRAKHSRQSSWIPELQSIPEEI
ncbi:pentatricopeptide repeat-containing protein [Pyrus ussuriensis x Pyrus communis]|uniref:Pentatricopeptide repeat-containing protein n=1 Tax=Pyrus ussuriensis x Pyrus communis TaxID=2448454 RepID=A0A5N5ICG1_9ROSA|nr:pentatricopeptide repeat-containing protein [Pyrus ussuriensis x Pyrus communis]